MSLLAGFAFSLLGVHYLREGYRQTQSADTGGGPANLQDSFRGVLGRGTKHRSLGPGQQVDQYARMSPVMKRGPAKGTVEQVANGSMGLNQRIQRIQKLVKQGALDPAVRKLAGEIVAKRCPDKPGGWCVGEKDWEAEARAIFGWVRSNIRYTRDSAFADTYVHPARTLFDKAPGTGSIADCDDYAITMGALLGAIGHSAKLRVAAITNGDPGARAQWNHIWLVTCLPEGGAVATVGSRCIPLDASIDKPFGWQAPKERLYKVKDFEIK